MGEASLWRSRIRFGPRLTMLLLAGLFALLILVLGLAIALLDVGAAALAVVGIACWAVIMTAVVLE